MQSSIMLLLLQLHWHQQFPSGEGSHMKNTMTVRQAAQKLGTSLRFIYDLLWSGKLAGRKVGTQWLISGQAVEARLKAREAQRGTAGR